MTEPDTAPQTVSAADSLPPVEPPNFGFIVQLFVVPAVIVGIIVLVWLGFNWLARMGGDSSSYVRALEHDNPARWQAAVNLANALQQPNSRLRQDEKLAKDLSGVLTSALATEPKPSLGRDVDSEITLRVYLCRALGKFEVPTGLDALLAAATTERNESEQPVRRAALEAIAQLIDQTREGVAPSRDKLLETLEQCADDQEAGIRGRAAYALGVLSGDADAKERSVALLDRLLADASADVRYNAATGLARHGHVEAVGVLAEMLDPARVAGLDTEPTPAAKARKQTIIAANALKAADKMAVAGKAADLAPLLPAIEALGQSADDAGVRDYARQLAEKLSKTLAEAPAPK
ncbi:MAG: HEAT repeat domain-containing protein [Pirellulales bacterium]